MSWIHNISSCVTIFPLTHWTELISFEFTREFFAAKHENPKDAPSAQIALKTMMNDDEFVAQFTFATHDIIFVELLWAGGGEEKFSASQCSGKAFSLCRESFVPDSEEHKAVLGKHEGRRRVGGNGLIAVNLSPWNKVSALRRFA